MPPKITTTPLDGVMLIEPQVFGDQRGFFSERWNATDFAAAGLHLDFTQISHSSSVKGTIRGLHFQEPDAQGKLVWAIRGAVYDVVVDIRRGSPTFGRHAAFDLSENNFRQLWIPPGFAHGFAVTSDRAELLYAITGSTYVASSNRSILWSDPDLGIAWPVAAPVVSDKDMHAPLLKHAPFLPEFTMS